MELTIHMHQAKPQQQQNQQPPPPLPNPQQQHLVETHLYDHHNNNPIHPHQYAQYYHQQPHPHPHPHPLGGIVLQNPNPNIITPHLIPSSSSTQYYNAAVDSSSSNAAAAAPSSSSSYVYTYSQQQQLAAPASSSSYLYDPHAPAPSSSSSSAYYYEPNYNYALHSTAAAAVAAYAISAENIVPSSETGQFAAGNPNSILWNGQSFVPQNIGTWKKRQTKTKIVQSAYCEVCKVDCNSKDVLEQHKLGKKHKKNLEKLKETMAPTPSATARSNNPIIGPQENPQKAKAEETHKSKKKKAQGTENLETKRRKVVEGGAAVEAVRTCTICNVVCNSDTVFSYHLAGQKHLAMVKKRAAGRN